MAPLAARHGMAMAHTPLLAQWCAALLFAAAAVTAVNVVYDETGWTKLDWPMFKVQHDVMADPSPLEEAVSSLSLRTELAAAALNSVDGPVHRKPSERLSGCVLCPGREAAAAPGSGPPLRSRPAC